VADLLRDELRDRGGVVVLDAHRRAVGDAEAEALGDQPELRISDAEVAVVEAKRIEDVAADSEVFRVDLRGIAGVKAAS